jgi:hypothetical protein
VGLSEYGVSVLGDEPKSRRVLENLYEVVLEWEKSKALPGKIYKEALGAFASVEFGRNLITQVMEYLRRSELECPDAAPFGQSNSHETNSHEKPGEDTSVARDILAVAAAVARIDLQTEIKQGLGSSPAKAHAEWFFARFLNSMPKDLPSDSTDRASFLIEYAKTVGIILEKEDLTGEWNARCQTPIAWSGEKFSRNMIDALMSNFQQDASCFSTAYLSQGAFSFHLFDTLVQPGRDVKSERYKALLQTWCRQGPAEGLSEILEAVTPNCTNLNAAGAFIELSARDDSSQVASAPGLSFEPLIRETLCKNAVLGRLSVACSAIVAQRAREGKNIEGLRQQVASEIVELFGNPESSRVATMVKFVMPTS